MVIDYNGHKIKVMVMVKGKFLPKIPTIQNFNFNDPCS